MAIVTWGLVWLGFGVLLTPPLGWLLKRARREQTRPLVPPEHLLTRLLSVHEEFLHDPGVINANELAHLRSLVLERMGS